MKINLAVGLSDRVRARRKAAEFRETLMEQGFVVACGIIFMLSMFLEAH